MILKIYSELLKIGLTEFGQIVTSGRILYTQSGEPWKIRFELNDKSLLDAYYSISGKYSYHWDRRLISNQIYRHDNAPHAKWKGLKTYPKHFHDGNENNATESSLPDSPEDALREFLLFIRSRIYTMEGDVT